MKIKNVGDIIEEHGGIDAFYEYLCSDKCRTFEIKKGKGMYSKLKKIYDIHIDDIMGSAEKNINAGYDPYFVNWSNLFTPIEYDCWCSIRCQGVILFPQFSVAGYILDFANPYLKIAVECDGKDWHNEEKDKLRDTILYEKHGWKTFRIKGSEFYVDYKLPCEVIEYGYPQDSEEYKQEHENRIMNTGDGVIKSIHEVYFRKHHADDIYYRSLSKHSLINYAL